MKDRLLSAIVAGVAMVVASAGVASAQDEGVKKVEGLIKKANAELDSIKSAKQQLLKTMDAYNAVLAPNVKDRRDAYKNLQKEMASTEKKRADVMTRSAEMNAAADKLFKDWQTSTAAIHSADLRTRSEERLKRTQDRFAELRQMGDDAQAIYAPIMKTLQDQVTYLGHDLNAGAVASLKPDADKLNEQAKNLYAAIDRVTDGATANITKLRAE